MVYNKAVGRMNWRQRLVAVALVLGYVAVSAAAAMGAQPKASATGTAAGAAATATAPAATVKPPMAPKAPAVPIAPPEAAESGASDAGATGVGTVGTSQSIIAGDGTIELHAKNEDLANLLEMISQKYNLNIIVSRGAKGRVTVDLYKATVDQALDAMCRTSGLKWSREGNTIYVCTAEEGAAARLDESRLVTEVFPLNYVSGEDAMKLVAPTLSSKATVAVNLPAEKGIASGGTAGTGGNSFGLQDSLVIRDFPENLAAVRAVLKRMDRRPRQVLVEATILRVKLNDSTSLGINFNTLAGVDFRDLTPGSSGSSGSGSGSGSTTTSGIPVINPGSFANGATVPQTMKNWASISTQGFAAPGTGLNFGIITNNIAVFIQALETVSDTTVLSNPKVLALNKQRAEVIVGQRLGYRTTTQTETSTVQTVQFLDTGTQLIFRPFISDDGFIRMEIHPKVSSGTVTDDLPQEDTTEVTCNIMVKDGHTIVIGGMFDETSTISRSQVPGLGNIPGLGLLFRNNTDSSVRNEVIVLLTPHIIDNIEVADEIGRQFLEDGKRHCLGMRENFACFTRERIAVAYLMEADRAWAKYQETGKTGDRDWALWNVNLALGVGPNNLKAIRLKDRILSEKMGQQYQPPNWTVWDSLSERLRQYDRDRAAAPAEPEPPPPAAPAEAPKAASSAAPAAPAVPAPTHAAPSTPWPVAMIAVAPPAAPEPATASAPAAAPDAKETPDENR